MRGGGAAQREGRWQLDHKRLHRGNQVVCITRAAHMRCCAGDWFTQAVTLTSRLCAGRLMQHATLCLDADDWQAGHSGTEGQVCHQASRHACAPHLKRPRTTGSSQCSVAATRLLPRSPHAGALWHQAPGAPLAQRLHSCRPPARRRRRPDPARPPRRRRRAARPSALPRRPSWACMPA